MKDPGRPTPDEVERHKVTQIFFRSWYPACVVGKARDRKHRQPDDQEHKRLLEKVFDC